MAGRDARAPLPPHVRRAARTAGGWGLALGSAGVTIVAGLVVVAIVVALARWALLDLLRGSGDLEASARAWLASIDPTPWVVTIVVALAVAACLVALGALVSTRLLRGADVQEARAITWWCLGAGTVVQAAILAPASALSALVGLVTGGLGLPIVLGISLAISLVASSIASYVAGPWLWTRRTRRVLERAQAARA